MKQAGNAEFIVWAIVAVVVMVAKGLGKLATPTDETPPVPKPAPQPRPRVQPRPAAVPSHRVAVHHRVPPLAPPVVEVTPPVMPSTAAVAEETPAKTTPPAVPPASPSRSNQWATALRDRQNIRNVIIANEIIGRPVSLREM